MILSPNPLLRPPPVLAWGALGYSWGALGRSWAALGPLLARCWALLGRSWAGLWRFLVLLGDVLESLGASEPLWVRSWTLSDRSWSPLGTKTSALSCLGESHVLPDLLGDLLENLV